MFVIYKNGQIIEMLQTAIYKNGKIIANLQIIQKSPLYGMFAIYKNGQINAILQIIKIPIGCALVVNTFTYLWTDSLQICWGHATEPHR
jgi:hypothetical protein